MPLHRLAPQVQHYEWGDVDFIPSLLGQENRDARPHAELWMGAHPDLPSLVDGESLEAFIEKDPEATLGPDVARAFGGRLPYLIKVLAAREPLSVQAHPTEAQARRGFAREDAAGIPRDAPTRSYRDRSAKPELIVALTDFYALAGFRPLEEIAAMAAEVPELHRLAPELEPSPEALEALYTRIMTLSQSEVDALLSPLVGRLRSHSYDRTRHEHWLVRCDDAYAINGHHDRGLFSVLLLNLVHLRPGQALFLDAGTLHSYLEGAGLEVMTSSNNVLRGGLTRKHLAIDELLGILRFEGGAASVLEPERVSPSEQVYRTDTDAFELARIDVRPEHPHERSRERYGAEILFASEASVASRRRVRSETAAPRTR